jgi:hypothetical protein
MAIRLESPQPARASRAVVFACDGHYARFALFAAEQIARLNPTRDFDICLCAMGEDLAAPPGLVGKRLRLCRVETDGIFRSLRLDARRTEASYLRLALPAAFAGEYARLLYLDADVFVQGGDFAGLFGVDIGPHPLAAVRDNMQWRTPDRRPDSFRRLGLAATRVFNSGVQLIDVAAFNDQQVLERCLAFGRSHSPARIGLDQDLINAVLHGGWAELSPVWNWQYTWASRLFEAMEGANIVHFIGPQKPWKHDRGEFPLRFRRAYRAFMAEHYPEDPVGPDGPSPHQNPGFLRRMLVKHLLALGKTCRYLDRFPNALTVHP